MENPLFISISNTILPEIQTVYDTTIIHLYNAMHEKKKQEKTGKAGKANRQTNKPADDSQTNT